MLKSMYALRIADLIGRVDSRIWVIFMMREKEITYRESDDPPQI